MIYFIHYLILFSLLYSILFVLKGWFLVSATDHSYDTCHDNHPGYGTCDYQELCLFIGLIV